MIWFTWHLASNLANCRYSFVRWINADKHALPNELKEFAHCLSIDTDNLDTDEIWSKITDELADRERWLVVFDNFDEPRALVGIGVPASLEPLQHVLVTSQSSCWDEKDTFDLSTFSLAESVAYLLDKKSCAEVGCDESTLSTQPEGRLAKLLGRLPIALAQAAGYIRKQKCGTEEYLRLWQEEAKGPSLLAKDDRTGNQQQMYQHTVLTTWKMALAKLSSGARALLAMMCYLAPDEQPKAVLRRAVGNPGTLALNELVRELTEYFLVSVTGSSTLQMHRLVQQVIQIDENNNGVQVERDRILPLAEAMEAVVEENQELTFFRRGQPHVDRLIILQQNELGEQ